MPPKSSKTPLEQLADAVTTEKTLVQQLSVAKRHTAKMISQCLESGIALETVADAADLSPSAARSRLKADPSSPDAWPSVKRRAEVAEQKRQQPRARAVLQPAPKGFARMTEAAEILGLSRSGIYYKIAAGELTVREIDGHRYVKLPKT